MVAAGEDGRCGARDGLGAGVADGVDPLEDGDQAALGESFADLIGRESEVQQLLARDVPVLLGREGGDLGVLWNA